MDGSILVGLKGRGGPTGENPLYVWHVWNFGRFIWSNKFGHFFPSFLCVHMRTEKPYKLKRKEEGNLGLIWNPKHLYKTKKNDKT